MVLLAAINFNIDKIYFSALPIPAGLFLLYFLSKILYVIFIFLFFYFINHTRTSETFPIFVMPNYCSVSTPSSIRIDAQSEFGLFLCPSVSFSCGVKMVFIYENYGCLFPHFICSDELYYDSLATSGN